MLFWFLKDTQRKGMPPFIQQIEAKNGVQIVRLRGPIDMRTIPDINVIGRKALENSRSFQSNILLDFEKVDHIDSSTCAMLVKALFEIKHEHHKLALVNISPELRNMLEISHLRKLFLIFESEKEAIDELIESHK